jgi:hypothetical protein
MDNIAIPDWLGAAVLGAVLAVLGYVGTQFVQWLGSLREAERARRAKLAELLALLRAGHAAWQVQCENRNRLVRMIKERGPELAAGTRGYDQLLAAAHSTFTREECDLHDVVRAITVHTFHPLNQALLHWLQADSEFRVRPPDQTPRGQLSKYLADLETHLLLWEAKYRIWIPDHPERALVYLADEERHGVGFPKDGARLVTAILHQRRWVGA